MKLTLNPSSSSNPFSWIGSAPSNTAPSLQQSSEYTGYNFGGAVAVGSKLFFAPRQQNYILEVDTTTIVAADFSALGELNAHAKMHHVSALSGNDPAVDGSGYFNGITQDMGVVFMCPWDFGSVMVFDANHGDSSLNVQTKAIGQSLCNDEG